MVSSAERMTGRSKIKYIKYNSQFVTHWWVDVIGNSIGAGQWTEWHNGHCKSLLGYGLTNVLCHRIVGTVSWFTTKVTHWRVHWHWPNASQLKWYRIIGDSFMEQGSHILHKGSHHQTNHLRLANACSHTNKLAWTIQRPIGRPELWHAGSSVYSAWR